MGLTAARNSSNGFGFPPFWSTAALSDCCQRLTVGFVGTCEPFYTTESSGVLLLRTGNLQEDRIELAEVKYVTKDFHAANKKSAVRKGDILIARHGNSGNAVLVPDTIDDVNALNIVIVRTDPQRLTNSFAAYCINSDGVRRQAIGRAAGSTQVVINTREVATLVLPIPPLPEQKAIAAALSDVDALLGTLDRLIAKKRHLKQAAMQQLFTGQTRLPGFSGKWESKCLGEFARVRNEKVLPKQVEPGTACVELEHVGQGDGRLHSCATANDSTSSKYRFRVGDVLFGRLRPYLRKFWLADRDGICTTEIWPLVADERLAFNGFLHAVVQTPEFVDTASISYGTHMPRADWGIVKNFAVHLPSIKEQRALANVLADMDAELTALEQRRNKIRFLKQGMTQELLTGRRRLV